MQRFIGMVLQFVLWGFFLGCGLWLWRRVEARWAEPAADKLEAKLDQKLNSKKGQPGLRAVS